MSEAKRLPRKPFSPTAQPNMADAAKVRVLPTPPPHYRPQPVPRVLQTKLSVSRQPFNEAQRARTLLFAPRPQPAPQASVPKRFTAKSIVVQPALLHRSAAPPVIRRPSARSFSPAIVQAKATKFYPNLHPGAVEPIDASNIFRLNSFADQYRLHKVNSHGVNVPNQQYNFVRTREGEMLLHSRYRHPSIAEGKQVLYAGEIFFNNGKLQWWSNGSGHYQPDRDGAEQANLPMDYFFSYQQIIKGEHTRKRM